GKSGNGTDKYGFSVLPAGYYDGGFRSEGNDAVLWSASVYSSYHVWYQNFRSRYDYATQSYSGKEYGLSLRCLKD
ncbi:MAG: hypothetical protein MJY85_06710, partial [Fibrobacter sp.]|nr:hypothetical protein [Fibrobacter sp.]